MDRVILARSRRSHGRITPLPETDRQPPEVFRICPIAEYLSKYSWKYSRPRRGKGNTLVMYLLGWSKVLGSSAAAGSVMRRLLPWVDGRRVFEPGSTIFDGVSKKSAFIVVEVCPSAPILRKRVGYGTGGSPNSVGLRKTR